MTTTIHLPAEVPSPAFTYAEFRALVGTLAAERRTSGPDQSPGLIRYTDQNQAHLDRAYVVPLVPELVDKIRELPQPEQWLVLGEAWCGDTAHLLPTLAHLAEESAGKIQLHLLLRSDHPDLMAAHQTNGGNSIPKLVRRDAASGADLGDWGPRPAAAQQLAKELHADKDLHVNAIIKTMNAWYEADNGQAMQQELLAQLG
ncbi:hypothetical protein BEN47_16430 [Hymenobacter lapidarius]|uniref:Thioredoxin n=1 Tax=Hymenobacter lapidarius TaxID=1908237 RepID=A0A1G1T043_9BACT|nr:thioredoxin family protein [Hymenobacter lapidarius]OGX84240.1 hypothetical protein BEN47_16430 [Hymenobacter lapidarius]